MNHEIGQGVLAWPAVERQTDRYGAVLLSTGPDHRQAVVLDTLAAARRRAPGHGRARPCESPHVGDTEARRPGR